MGIIAAAMPSGGTAFAVPAEHLSVAGSALGWWCWWWTKSVCERHMCPAKVSVHRGEAGGRYSVPLNFRRGVSSYTPLWLAPPLTAHATIPLCINRPSLACETHCFSANALAPSHTHGPCVAYGLAYPYRNICAVIEIAERGSWLSHRTPRAP